MQATALMFEGAQAADDAFDRVVREREEQLLRISCRILGNWADAEEIVQDAFVRLHRHGLSFPSEIVLGSWLYRVTVNLCIDRSRRVRQSAELGEIGADASAEADLLRDERKRLLMAALQTLPAKERAAVVLREIEGLSTPEVAAILRSREATVRSQISRALVRLRGVLEKGRL